MERTANARKLAEAEGNSIKRTCWGSNWPRWRAKYSNSYPGHG
jgi:hypothetical protein